MIIRDEDVIHGTDPQEGIREGDPTQNISVCRNIKKVWVKGVEAAN
ncbi:MAG: hypothetical protein IJ559_01200 [Prevotella sp.]|nr:hypothetical protein [Prevotella sp.]